MPSGRATDNRIPSLVILLGLLVFASGCSASVAPQPTTAPAAVVAATETAAAALQPTWTRPATRISQSTAVRSLAVTPRASRTPLQLPPATPTASPSATRTLTPTETATATPGPLVTVAPPVGQPNLLPNPSFEEGWYHPNGIDELQVPNRWALEWLEGTNQLDPDPWNAWVRPEVRVLSPEFLPAAEHDLFIWDGKQTLKAFKGAGAISFNLQTSVYLEPGTYLFVIHVFPDLVVEYLGGGQKVWAPDPLSGEVAFIVDGVQQPWQLPQFGRKNRFTHRFFTERAGLVQLGVAIRGRWAITNNGWFLDDWALYEVEASGG